MKRCFAVLVCLGLVGHAWAQEHDSFVNKDTENMPNMAVSEDLSANSAFSAPSPRLRYVLQGVKIEGNYKTRRSVILDYITLERGDVVDVEDDSLEAIRYRLLGTGFFSSVRLSLKRGSKRGYVILLVTVTERNTLRIDQVAAGIAEGVRRTADRTADIEPFFGVALSDRNFFGTGLMLSGATALSPAQQGVRLGVLAPRVVAKEISLSGSIFFNNAREFFGGDDVRVSIACPAGISPADCPEEVLAKNAVVRYKRAGLKFGSGQELSSRLYLTVDWQGELVDVTAIPDAASQKRGNDITPIDFAIDPDLSVVSMVELALTFDRRDNPVLPSKGLHFKIQSDHASRFIASDYDYFKLQVQARYWFKLPWGHTLRLGAFGGAIFGRAPFFQKFYVADLNDLLPSRMLGLNFDRRRPPSILGTAAKEMRNEDLAGRVDVQYAWPVYRNPTGIRATDLFFTTGLYYISSRRDLLVGLSGYNELSRIPVDLTFDFGLRMDTDIGVFQFAFSTMVGFLVL
ncbi:MAG: BamA/TamA family outer membrane protein [Myxococcales bacterium]|nr:MAG: BamA/TamA family outer membrane protein [Myxococcales bacterium]